MLHAVGEKYMDIKWVWVARLNKITKYLIFILFVIVHFVFYTDNLNNHDLTTARPDQNPLVYLN